MTHEPDSTADVPPELSRRRVLVGGATAVVCVAGVSGTASAQGTTSGVIPTPERWPDANLAGFEIRYGHSEETGGNTADRSGSEETAAADGDGTETEGTDAAAETGENGTETGDGASNGGETDDGEATDAETSADDPPACDFGDWPPDEIESHDVRLVDRKEDATDDEGETPEEDTTLFVSADVDVEPNAPYLINTFERCESDFVGVELESVEGGAVERDDDPEEVEDDDPNDTEAVDEDTPAQGPGFGLLAALAAIVGLGHLLDRRRSD